MSLAESDANVLGRLSVICAISPSDRIFTDISLPGADRAIIISFTGEKRRLLRIQIIEHPVLQRMWNAGCLGTTDPSTKGIEESSAW